MNYDVIYKKRTGDKVSTHLRMNHHVKSHFLAFPARRLCDLLQAPLVPPGRAPQD